MNVYLNKFLVYFEIHLLLRIGFFFVFVGFAATENSLWPVFATSLGSLTPMLITQMMITNSWPRMGSSWKPTIMAGLCQCFNTSSSHFFNREGELYQ
jgi:hypothetical protein